MRRRIAVVTSGRQDYGLLVPLLRAIGADPALELQLLVTGMHLAPEYGETVKQIEADGYPIAGRVETLVPGDSAHVVATSMARSLAGFSAEFDRLRPDILVLLGDRSETLAIAAAAVVHRLPIAHIHGGETTEGAVDEAFRHAITKMSLLHFPAAAIYRDRILQMGEAAERVHCVGALALDCITALVPPTRHALESTLGIALRHPFFVVTFHAVTLDDDSELQFAELLAALDEIDDARILFTRPNSDLSGRQLNSMIDQYVADRRDRAVAVAALGHLHYFGALKHASAVVGNSSSGLIEAPYLQVPTIDIGDRQLGRLMPGSVIHVPAERLAIRLALDRVLAADFRATVQWDDNPYGDGKAASRIVEVLRRAKYDRAALKKRFHCGVAA